jgi:3-oxoacyl-[acyl-carrier-protein] synthase-3
METDSERLMREGIATGKETFAKFLDEVGWSRDEIDRSFCHQVGMAHRKRMLETLQVNPETDYVTVDRLGNTGSVALPITMALAIDDGYLHRGHRVAMLGIGSGINSLMLGVQWQRVPAATATTTDRLAALARFRKPHVPSVATPGGRPI